MRSLFLVVMLLITPAFAGEPPFTVAAGLFDTTRPDDLGLKPVPGTQAFTIFRAGEDSDPYFNGLYVNGVVLIGFKGKLYAQWQTSAKDEDAPDTHVVYSVSKDGAHWSKPEARSLAASGMMTSGGWLTDGKTLTAFTVVWNKEIRQGGRTSGDISTDGVHWLGSQPLIRFGASTKGVIRKRQLEIWPDDIIIHGVIEQDPHALPDGRIVTAFHLQPGLIATPFYTDDPKGLTGWKAGKMPHLPHQGFESREMEPSWFRRADGCLVMVFRDQESTFRQLASVSCDRGETWTTPVVTAMPDSRMKQSAGNLPDGTAFLVNAPSGTKLRSPLALTLSKDGTRFDRAFLLAAGPPPPVRYEGLYKRPGYHYPKSVVWNGALWIGYANAKENVAIVRLPLAGLH